MKKIIMFVLACLVCMNIAMACKQSYIIGEEVIIEDAIETAGNGSDCMLYLIYNNTLIQIGWMAKNDIIYNYSAGSNLSIGAYVANMECNISNSSFLGECKFVVERDNTMYTAIAVSIFALIAIVAYLGLKSEDSNLRLLLPMVALLTLIGGINAARVIAVDNNASDNLIGTIWVIQWTVMILGMIMIFYIMMKLVVAVIERFRAVGQSGKKDKMDIEE